MTDAAEREAAPGDALRSFPLGINPPTKETTTKANLYTDSQPGINKPASTPGSQLRRHGGSELHRRQQLSPNNWSAAALVLHDKEATVRKHYAHLRSDDGARWLDEIAGAAFARM